VPREIWVWLMVQLMCNGIKIDEDENSSESSVNFLHVCESPCSTLSLLSLALFQQTAPIIWSRRATNCNRSRSTWKRKQTFQKNQKVDTSRCLPSLDRSVVQTFLDQHGSKPYQCFSFVSKDSQPPQGFLSHKTVFSKFQFIYPSNILNFSPTSFVHHLSFVLPFHRFVPVQLSDVYFWLKRFLGEVLAGTWRICTTCKHWGRICEWRGLLKIWKDVGRFLKVWRSFSASWDAPEFLVVLSRLEEAPSLSLLDVIHKQTHRTL
jgi:hypothetical protein